MWSRKDCASVLLAAVVFLIVGLLLFPPVTRPAPRPRCSIGPFETCLRRAANLTLARAGVSARVDRVTCNRAKTRCELRFARGLFCVTVRVHAIGRGRWSATTSPNHVCKEGPPA